jgi:hypothetical protein
MNPHRTISFRGSCAQLLVICTVTSWAPGCTRAATPRVAAPENELSASSTAAGFSAATPEHSATALPADDPLTTDPDKYHLVLESPRVRVLRYQDHPGDKTQPHHHNDFVLYALSSFRRRLTFPDGTSKERDFQPGDVIWMKDQVHVGENVGTTDTDVVIVELK